MKIFFTLMMICCHAVLFGQSSSLDEFLRSADHAYEQNDYAKAAADYEKVLLVENKDHKILNRAGISYFKLKNFAKAKDKFRLAALYGPVDDDETMSSYYSNLSACYTYLNEDSKAFEYALKGYNLDKRSTYAFWNAASNAQNVGRYTDCIKIMNDSNLPKLNVLNTLYARSYSGLKQYNKSIKHYEEFFANYVPDEMDVNIILDDERYFYFKALLCGGNEDQISTQLKKKYQEKQVFLFEELKDTSWGPKIVNLLIEEKNANDAGVEMTEGTLAQIYKSDYLSAIEKIQVENQLRNFKAAYKTGTDYLQNQSDETTAAYKKMKLYQYVASISLLLEHFKKNKTEDPKLLNQTIGHFKDFYKQNKDYKFAEIEGDTDLLEPIQMSFIALQKIYPDKEEKKETAELFYKVLESIPSSDGRVFFGKMKALKVFEN